MNLRILKKLSRRAAPLLPRLGDDRQQFPAERDDNYTGLLILERKHWERGRSVHADVIREREVKTPAKDGRGWVYAHPPDHPRKGTIMVGAVSGYYEPEWDEETAWEALDSLVRAEFTDWAAMAELDAAEEEDAEPATPRAGSFLLRPLRTPTDIFAAAAELIAKREARP